MNNLNPPAIVRKAEDKRSCAAAIDLVASNCEWAIGEHATQFAEQGWGTYEDLAKLLECGLSAESLRQRAKVFSRFNSVRKSKTFLKWSHYLTAFVWPDAEECLDWAEENEASIREMKAWRRAVHGEDLTADADDAPAADVLGEPYRDPDPSPPPPTTTVHTPKEEAAGMKLPPEAE